jgi:transcriptional regulator with XRE-family HTH domain
VQRLHYRKAFGDAIQTYRRKAGLTQEGLAERADLHHNFIGALTGPFCRPLSQASGFILGI